MSIDHFPWLQPGIDAVVVDLDWHRVEEVTVASVDQIVAETTDRQRFWADRVNDRLPDGPKCIGQFHRFLLPARHPLALQMVEANRLRAISSGANVTAAADNWLDKTGNFEGPMPADAEALIAAATAWLATKR